VATSTPAAAAQQEQRVSRQEVAAMLANIAVMLNQLAMIVATQTLRR